MLRCLRTKWRLRTALSAAVLYTCSVFAPSVAVALGHSSIHCINELHAVESVHDHDHAAHVHKDGSVHHHNAANAAPDAHNGHDKGPPDKCCNLFPMSALALAAETSFGKPIAHALDFARLEHKLRGRHADRLDRPPNV